ncbi:MAG: DUF6029 family protein [Bacteroidales bacterium]|jgi:hypothetical protein|nr:DUF6029 family protein [Bacteroidales bacterium]
MKFKYFIVFCISLSFGSMLSAQNLFESASVSGSLQSDAQFYFQDKALGITEETMDGKHFGMNTFGELNYSVGKFRAGVRFEAYTPQLNGFDSKSKGFGLPFFYAAYSNKYIDVTIGDFYEQFGSGLALRSYQEWNLGYDNAIRGARVAVMPYKGIKLTALTGYQRWFWNNYVNMQNYSSSRGLVSGFDGDFFLNDIFNIQGRTQITLGGSFVTKHETDLNKTILIGDSLYQLNLPENVATGAGRINITHGGFGFSGEYAYKINNPSAYNNYIYRPGQALYLTASYSMKGFGVTIAAKRIDNMSYKSNMETTDNALDINFIPPLSKQHHYSLPSLYPYASQLNGEMSLKGNVIYTIPKNTKIGGKYGMSIEVDATFIYDIKKEAIDDSTPIDQAGTLGYNSPFFAVGDNNLYRDINVIITKRFSKNWKGIFTYINLLYDKDRVEGHEIGEYGIVKANIGIADVSWKINSKNTLRAEAQMLFTKQDKGNWATLTLEYTLAPHWFITIMDEYNYGNPDKDQKLHYYNISAGYVYKSTRVSVAYGRQREGLLCIGGVCRYVPAASGISLSLSTSF